MFIWIDQDFFTIIFSFDLNSRCIMLAPSRTISTRRKKFLIAKSTLFEKQNEISNQMMQSVFEKYSKNFFRVFLVVI